MGKVGIILRRELASYFATPLAYVFIVIFLVLAAAFTFYLGGFYERGQADLEPFFTFHPWLYLFLIDLHDLRVAEMSIVAPHPIALRRLGPGGLRKLSGRDGCKRAGVVAPHGFCPSLSLRERAEKSHVKVQPLAAVQLTGATHEEGEWLQLRRAGWSERDRRRERTKRQHEAASARLRPHTWSLIRRPQSCRKRLHTHSLHTVTVGRAADLRQTGLRITLGEWSGNPAVLGLRP